jgi:hypothetical protein
MPLTILLGMRGMDGNGAQACPVCNKPMRDAQALKNHRGAAAQRDASYPCDTCNQVFCSENALRSHSRDVHGTVPLPPPASSSTHAAPPPPPPRNRRGRRRGPRSTMSGADVMEGLGRRPAPFRERNNQLHERTLENSRDISNQGGN